MQAANRQLRLVEDLLLVTALNNKPPQSQSELILIAPLAHQAAEEVSANYQDQHIAISGPTDIAVRADPTRVLQILTNLLDNAAKYSPEGRDIRMSWDTEDNLAVLHVRDHGQGIPPEGRQYLFKRFGRVPGSQMRAGHIGTGLGLFLGRQLARAMGGELDLEATGPTGSTFRLELPNAHPMVR
jgi:signal transduction histidine kinase